MFFEQLENICEQRGAKLTPLLQKLGISTGNISKWRKGTIPNGDILSKLAKELDCTVDFLLGRVGQRTIEIPPADPEKARQHQAEMDKIHADAWAPVFDAIKKTAPGGEQPERDVIARAREVLTGLSDAEIQEVLRYAEYVISQRKQ